MMSETHYITQTEDGQNKCTFDINQTVLSNTPIINRNFYSIEYNNGYIYGADAVNFSDQGWSYRYNSNGVIVDSVQTGIIPEIIVLLNNL